VTERHTRISPEEQIALLEETLEATHDGLLVLDLERRVVRYNRQFLRMFDLTAAEVDSGDIRAIAAKISGEVENPGQLMINAADPWVDPSMEILDTITFKDGRVYERFLAPHRVGGRIIGRVASYRDITQTVRAEELLEQHRAFLEKAQEVAHIGSWIAELDESDRLTWSNETYRIFGITRDRFLSTTAAFYAFVHPDDRDMVARASLAAQKGDLPYDVDHRIIRADGDVRWVQEKADVVRGADGVARRMVGTVQDITERRVLEEQLRQSQKLEAIGRLAGGIAHDLNNSLTAIIGYTELALGALSGDHVARPDVHEIRRAAGRAEAVTRQLLAFSRKQMLEPRLFSLRDSVVNLARLVEQLLGASIAIATTVPEDLPPIYGDPGRIEQAILNIALNAKDAMPDGGQLTLAVSLADVDEVFAAGHRPMPAGRYVELRITDTGQGMDAATKARVFEPFFTTKDVGKGTGLGLAMVYGTVRQSGGYVFVDSELHRGTTFTVYFRPAEGNARIDTARTGANERTTPATVPVVEAPATVLVVEDETPVRNLVVTTLRRKGYRMLHAASAAEGMALSRAEPGAIDLLLIDASMPGMSGLDLAKTLAAERPGMRVAVMSGFTEETLDLGRVGATAVLVQKPFAPAELQRRIAELLG
jgi:two-component system cell cycle sensor histidine kinase/response regulator CckA